jgi:hypothetical protein
VASEGLDKAARIRAPIAGETFAISASTTPASVNLTSYVGRWVTIVADGAKVYFLTGSSQANAELVDNSATSGNGRAQMIPDGGSFSYEITAAYPWLGVETSAGTAVARVHISSDRVA